MPMQARKAPRWKTQLLASEGNWSDDDAVIEIEGHDGLTRITRAQARVPDSLVRRWLSPADYRRCSASVRVLKEFITADGTLYGCTAGQQDKTGEEKPRPTCVP